MQRALAGRPPLLHPLAGARLRVLLEKTVGNGPYTGRTRLTRLLAGAIALALEPFARFQRHQWGHRIASREIGAGPVFIVGHWRSGTTFLHNIMSRDPSFGWLSLLQTVLPSQIMIERDFPLARRLVEAVTPSRRGTDEVPFGVDTPQEEEWALANLGALSFFNAYYFPQHYRAHFRRGVLLEGTSASERAELEEAYRFLARSLDLRHGGRMLLFKNPSATARLPLLKKIFPRARFIHVVRNPYEVFASSLARFPRLMSALAWEPFEDIDFEPIVLESYEDLMRRFLEDRESIPPEDLVEIRYEKLAADPVGEVERIYEAFDLPSEIDAFERIDEYVASQRDYRRNLHGLTRRQAGLVRERWAFAFQQWPYDLPDIEIGDE